MTVSLRSSSVAFLTAGPGAGSELWHCSCAVLARAGEPVRLIPGAARGLPWPRGADDLRLGVAPVAGARPTNYAGLVLIGTSDAASAPADHRTITFITGFFKTGLPVAAAGYGALYLAQAGLVRDRRLTAATQLRACLTEAGAAWVNEPVASCVAGPNLLITCGSDQHNLPRFCDAFTRAFAAHGLAGPAAVLRSG